MKYLVISIIFIVLIPKKGRIFDKSKMLTMNMTLVVDDCRLTEIVVAVEEKVENVR
jgi:hypothetical protein